MRLFKILLGALIFGGGLFLFLHSRVVEVPGPSAPMPQANIGTTATSSVASILPVPEFQTSGTKTVAYTPPLSRDLPPQMHLSNPPTVVKGIYVTGWTAGSDTRMTQLINLVKRTELNAMVIDIKDYSGYLSYAMDIPLAHEIGAERELRIARPNALIKRLHDNGIYVIGRVTVFQDPILSKARPELALQKNVTGTIPWTDNKGLGWMDPAGKPTWDYIVAVAKDALARGFDEINFDYIRFASDGDLGGIKYPFWDKKTSRSKVIAQFFNYLKSQLGDARISADLFGLATVNHDDLGIGQVIEDAYKVFDDVAPMTYPSHYASGFLGYKNPATYPYEVIKYSMEHARARLLTASRPSSSATGTIATQDVQPISRLRPWLQDFNLGAKYTADMVRAQIRAVDDVFAHGTSSAMYGGWLLWNPSNVYTEAALQKE